MKLEIIGSIERTLEKRVPATGIGLFRIFFGTVVLQEILFLSYFRHLIFDPIPYIEPAGRLIPFALAAWLGVACCLIFGLFTFACSIANYVLWVLFVLLTPMWHDFDGGFDQLMTGSSLILIFVHSESRFSLDNLRFKLKSSGTIPKIAPDIRCPAIYYYILIGVSLGLLYFDAALHKLHSEIWLNGLGAWVPNTMPYYISPFDFDWFTNNRVLQKAIGYTLILFQLSFLFLFTRRQFRIPILIIGVAFHLGIIFCLNIYPFGFGMLVHYILLVPFKWWKWIAEKIKYDKPALHTYYNGADRNSRRLALILEHFDFQNFSAFHCVSAPDQFPALVRKKYSDFDSFHIASLDRHDQVFEGCDGFRGKGRFKVLLFLLQTIDLVRIVIIRNWARLRIRTNRDTDELNRKAGLVAERQRSTELPVKRIYYFLAFVFILQLNSTMYYSIVKSLDRNQPLSNYGKLIREASVYVTSISHILFGITPHALYMDDHFNDYRQLTAFTYIDSTGQEKWLPFIAPDGRFVSPNWGRVHSMWANVAMHPPFNPSLFERLSMKVTAFWAHKLGLGTADSTFVIKTKPIQISYNFVNDLRKKNLNGNWRDFGRIHWSDGNYSIRYASRKSN